MDGATRKEIRELTGEDPVDVLGNDLEGYGIEDDEEDELGDLTADETDELEAFENDLWEGEI